MNKEFPQSIESEEILISCLLNSNSKYIELCDTIFAEDFYSTKCKLIFQAITDLFSKYGKYDIITIRQYAKDKKLEVEASYIANLVSKEITIHNAGRYAETVKDKSIRRQLLTAQNENEQLIYSEGEDINSVLAKTQDSIFKISPLKIKNNKIETIIKDLQKLQEEYSKKYEEGKRIIGFSTGIKKVDFAIDGIRPGHFWVVGGWHGTGKTSFALNIVHELIEQDVEISIITLEMSQVDLAAKIIGIRHGMSSMKVIKGMLTEEEHDMIEEGKYFLNKSKMEIHTEFELEKIKLQIRKDVYTRGVKVVIIDYLQKIMDKKVFDETPLASKVSKELANLAQELKVSIIVLSQISNEAQKGQGAGAGFKGSGTIEASADLAIVLKREKNKEQEGEEIVPIKIIITKNKFGFDGTINYRMHLTSGKFLE